MVSEPEPLIQSEKPELPVIQPEKKETISLKKSGDTHKINLSKNNNILHANLNWSTEKKKTLFGSNSAIDLDLACMYRLKNGMKGVIQALGNGFGNDQGLPFIKLDQDDRTGNSTGGENMFFTKPEIIDYAIIFAYIYDGVPNWKNTNAVVTIDQQGSPDIKIQIDSANTNQRFCVIASLSYQGSELEVKREEKFFASHMEVDKKYRFGFQWRYGKK